MINEVLEVQNYLAGKNISKKCLYRICYMLVKWFKQKGMSNIEIRDAIFAWGKKYGVYIAYNLNSIIYQALSDKHRLRGKTEIRVSDADIEEIKKRFDSQNCRKLALAILCLAKASADSENKMLVSVTALSNWVGIAASNISARCIPELIDFEYISKVENDNKTYSWNKNVKSKSLNLIIHVPIENLGQYILNDNNISELYSTVFTK